MFRRIVSNLPFSPALAGQLTTYAKILRREQATRQLGLIFIVLTIIIQSFAVFQPPESANASNPNDMVSGGIGSSLNNFLTPYNSNAKHLRDTIDFIGITPDEINSVKFSSFTTNGRISWGFAPRFGHDQAEVQYNVSNPQGAEVTSVYSRPINLWTDTSHQMSGWVGYSNRLGQFAIIQSNGNLITSKLPQISPTCIDNNPCPANIIKSNVATNNSQGFVDASSVVAKSNDLISYTITIENTNQTAMNYDLVDNLDDLLEYATLYDKGGGTLNETTKILSWPNITLGPNDIQTRTFVIKILNNIPATANGTSDSTSYDCIISNMFGNSTDIGIDCPASKIVEKITAVLPKVDPTANIIFMITILAISTYFYARSRQLKSEIRSIRKDINSITF